MKFLAHAQTFDRGGIKRAFNGFLNNLFYSFQNATDIFAQKNSKFLEEIFTSEICYRYN